MRDRQPAAEHSGRLAAASLIHSRTAARSVWGTPEDPAVAGLSEALKADLRARFARGERPEALEYLERHPELRADDERVLSLIYEEFCLREERGESPDPGAFCARYPDWARSLAAQLNFHRMLSQVAGTPQAPSRFPAPGDTFEGLEIVAEIGRGGAARVYLAHDQALGGREIAVKVSADPGSEASILGRLDHPNIVPVHSVRIDPSSHLRALCMPFRAGLPLDEVIRRAHADGPPRSARVLWDVLGPEDALPASPVCRGWDGFPFRGSYVDGVAWLAARLAQALAYAHGRGIYHRDVKPANILLTRMEGPQLLDFNLAHAPHSAEQAAAALRGGTLPYMAPEQLDAFRKPERWADVGAAADLYSLGLVVRELLLGASPPPADPDPVLPRVIQGLLDQRTGAPGPPLHELNPSVPWGLSAVIAHCLEPDPGDRYPGSDALADDLHRFLARRPLRHARNPSKRECVCNWARRWRAPLAAVALVAALAAPFAALEVRDRLTPLEAKAPFPEVLAAFDADQQDRARDLLTPWAPLWSARPAFWIYLALAQKEGKVTDSIENGVSRFWNDAPAVRRLGALTQTHPALLDRVEAFAVDLLRPLTDAEQARSRQRVRQALAWKGLEFVERQRPGRPRTREGFAVVLESAGRLESARALLDQQIASGPHVLPRGPALQTHLLRARVTTKMVQRLLDGAGPGDRLQEAQRLLDQTLQDLHEHAAQLRDLVLEPDDETVFQSDFILCEAKVAQGDLLKRRGLKAEAVGAYREAEALLTRLAHTAKKAEYFLELKRRVHSRLD